MGIANGSTPTCTPTDATEMEYFPRTLMHRRSSRVAPPPSVPSDGRGTWPGAGAVGGLGLGGEGEGGGGGQGGEKGHGNLKSATTTSTFSWSTISQETSAHYDRMLFDYRVMAQSMHAYRHISIFRRFGRLSMANLLFYQDELKQVEEALTSVDREETRWIQAGSEGSGDVVLELKETRIRLMRVLRETLKSYYEALLLQDQIFALDPPRHADSNLLAALEDPSNPRDGNLFTVNNDDLVALGLGGRDSLEKLVGRIIPRIFPHRNPSVEDVRHRNMSQRDIASVFSPFTRRITRMVIALGTAALMLGPMVILQFLTSDTWKLVCISLFTLVLAVLIALATRGRGESIVMVIAAYSAVLVVFVQGNNNARSGSCKSCL